MSAAPLVAFRGVHKRFGKKVVLDGVDLDVARGETVAILGASGAGKTVLIKALVGLMRVDAGEVRFDGIALERAGERVLASVRRRIGFVFQASALFDSISVADNVGYALRVRDRRHPQAVAERVARCLELVGLPGAEALLPTELSGGMRKRVAVARALAARPELLLYDEPTAGLDPANVRVVARLIGTVQKTLNATSIVVTHDRELALSVADRLALLADGRIAWLGGNAEARLRPAPLAAFFCDAEEVRP